MNFKFVKAVIVLFALFPGTRAIAMEEEEDALNTVSVLPRKVLVEIGEKFVSFLQDIGKSETPITQEAFPFLFTPQCKKIVNGATLPITSYVEHANQLNNARKDVGRWTIETLWTAADTEDMLCTVQFKWQGERMGPHTTMVGLLVDDWGKIYEIREVYNEYQKTLASQD